MEASMGMEADMAPAAAKQPLIDHFSALEDPRQAWKVVYPLPEVLLLVLCATLAGADDFVEVEAWGEEHLGFLRRLLPYADGIPSHDTLNDVMNALDAGLFAACFTAWVEGLRGADAAAAAAAGDEPDLVAIDGKTSRRTHARARGREPLHLVSAWASRQRLVLGQQATDAKSNEITAIPLLLERLALTGALVTIDAIGCQTKIAAAIIHKGADYLLAVKANWPALHGEIERYFADVPAADLDTLATTDGDHGRIEVRRHAVSRDVAWLSTDRRFPGEPRFPGLAAVAMVEAEVERGDGGTTLARRYFLSSASLDARLFARAVRCHWHIENRLHWVLDVVFRDDLCRLRTGHGPHNMAIVRHMAINLVRKAPGRHSLKVRRKRAAWNVDHLAAILYQTP
jgi:predicted transposase YbfD/YdcC